MKHFQKLWSKGPNIPSDDNNHDWHHTPTTFIITHLNAYRNSKPRATFTFWMVLLYYFLDNSSTRITAEAFVMFSKLDLLAISRDYV